MAGFTSQIPTIRHLEYQVDIISGNLKISSYAVAGLSQWRGCRDQLVEGGKDSYQGHSRQIPSTCDEAPRSLGRVFVSPGLLLCSGWTGSS